MGTAKGRGPSRLSLPSLSPTAGLPRIAEEPSGFDIATTSGNDWPAAAAIGGSQPSPASCTLMMLSAVLNQRSCWIVRNARRPIHTASGTSRQSSRA